MKTVAFIRATGIYDDSRSTKEICALAENGYCVKVLGWDRDGTSREKCEASFGDLKGNVSFHFYDVRAEHGIGLRHIDKLLGWLKWVKKTLETIDNLEVVHACDLDSGISAYRFCKKHCKPLVYDIFDYYIDTHNVPGFVRGFVEKLEIDVINYAAVTIICTEERKEQISKASPKKLIVIHNSPDVESPVAQGDMELDYAYCGSMSDKRLIFEILDESRNNTDLSVSMAGYGKHTDKAIELANAYEHFEFKGHLSYSEVLTLEANAKVLAAIYEPTIRNHRLCAPNKFYEALALAKPLIVCKGTGIDKIVVEHNIGIAIDYDSKQFYDALRFLLNNPSMREEMGNRARNLYEDKYRWSEMKKVLSEAYRQIF